MPGSMEAFGAWLRRRLAHAVETGDVPVDLLAGLRAEFVASRDEPAEQSRADAVKDIAGELEIPIVEVEARLSPLEA